MRSTPPSNSGTAPNTGAGRSPSAMTARAGVVATASYEARPYGVRSAPLAPRWRSGCVRNLIFVPARFDVYKAVSRQIRAVFRDYTELVEPLSLDEAFLDVSAPPLGDPRRPRDQSPHPRRNRTDAPRPESRSTRCWQRSPPTTGNPTDCSRSRPERIEEFVAGPARRAVLRHRRGDGPERCTGLGIRTGADLQALGRSGSSCRQFGKAGHSYYGYARGIDEREVTPNRVRKSLGAETTFAEDTDDREQLRLELSAVREEVWNRLMRHEFQGQDRRPEAQVRQLPPDNPVEDAYSLPSIRPKPSGSVSEELLAAVGFPRAEDPPDRPYGRQLARGLRRSACSCGSTSGIRPERLNDFSHDRRQHGKGKDDNCLKRDRLWGAKPLPDHRVFSNLREISQAPRTGRTIARRRVAA